MKMPAPTRRRFFVFGCVLALNACANGLQEAPQPVGQHIYKYGPAHGLDQQTYQAVDRLLQATPQLTPDVPVVVSSITDAQRIDQSSRFGNIVADLVRSRLAQEHVAVSEPRLRSAMLLKTNEGEMMLARDSRAIVPGPLYSLILTGTYAAADSRVYVALKLVSVYDARILSAVDFVVRRDNDISNLLDDPTSPPR